MSEQELDQLLDAALPGYVVEPPAGLEARILSRARRPRVWPWAFGFATAAALAVAALLPRPSAIEGAAPLLVSYAPAAPGVHAPPMTPASTAFATPVFAAPGVRTSAAAHAVPAAVASAPTSALAAAHHRRPPQRTLPLTRREHALIQFAQSNPDLARQVLVEAPEQMAAPLDLQPLAVEPITVEPLASLSGGE